MLGKYTDLIFKFLDKGYKDIFFNAPVQARYVKILPRKWWKKIAMRVDVLIA